MKQSNTFTSGFSKDKPKIIVSLEYAWEKVKKHNFISLSVGLITGASGSVIGNHSESDKSFDFNYDFIIRFLLFLLVGFAVIFGFYFIRFWFQFLVEKWRSSAWVVGIEKMQQLKSEVYSVEDTKWDEEKVKNFLTTVCENLKEFYAHHIKSVCGVSIKMSKTETSTSLETWEFSNFCRAKGREERDNDKRYTEKHHYLLDNTAFLTIINQFRHHEILGYVNNNVHASHDYKSSSFGCYDEQFGYDSELVYPIISFEGGQQYQAIHGFICIDSKGIDKFDENLKDIQLVKEYADIITHILTIKNK